MLSVGSGKEGIMSDLLLSVSGLRASVCEEEILKGLDLKINKGETHVIVGPNGAGKSTLGNVLMGNPTYEVTAGTAVFNGKNLFDMAVNERAKEGLFMTFQSPLEVPGISLENFLRTAIEERTGKKIRVWDFHKEIVKALERLSLDESYIKRDLNVGFSGGERKKAEILQLMMLEPTLAILDETDSGLDVDAVRTVSSGVMEFQKNKDAALVIITHNMGILSSLHVDKVHILAYGRIVKSGGPELMDYVNRNGFSEFEKNEVENG